MRAVGAACHAELDDQIIGHRPGGLCRLDGLDPIVSVMPVPADDDGRDSPSTAGCRWERATSGVLHLVVSGQLTADLRQDVADTLQARAPGSAPLTEIDLSGATFLDLGIAGMFERYHGAAAHQGAEVRVVNATGMPLFALQVLGISELLGIEPNRPGHEWTRRQSDSSSAAELVRQSRALVATSRAIAARSRQLRALHNSTAAMHDRTTTG